VSIPRNFTLPTSRAGIGAFSLRRRICTREREGVPCGAEFMTTVAVWCPACRKEYRATATCRDCHEQRHLVGRGRCSACYQAKRKEMGR
jgi:hypothetical protein